jgi:aminoglycoside phosphotransferase (APT) family kinase protein
VNHSISHHSTDTPRGWQGRSEELLSVPAGFQPHLTELADLEARWAEITPGKTLLHCDLRDDNLLVRNDGQIFVCDWNWAAIGAKWIDAVWFLIGPAGDQVDVESLLTQDELTATVPSKDIDSLLASTAGMWAHGAGRPLHPTSSPWLRIQQSWYAKAALDWLAHRRWD